MSDDLESTDVVMMCCASCGKVDVDDVKLKKCACKLVRYCTVECQRDHRPQHKKACKKRLAELRDDRLFTQPDESYLGECPICCLPLPLDENKLRLMTCCCKLVCTGCNSANKAREAELGPEQRCPYCREPVPDTDEEIVQNYMKRVKVNDPVALSRMGGRFYNEGDFKGAVEYWTKAATLGDLNAHYNLSVLYREGERVEKNEEKEVYHLEEAAIGGHHGARFNLANHEGNAGRYDRAMNHLIIAAKLGFDDALELVKKFFPMGLVSKEDFEAALRGHQAAVDATKSKQREEAYALALDNENN